MTGKRNRGRPRSMARDTARALGERHYNGKQCHAGHDGLRYVSTGACVDCVAEYRATINPADLVEE